jgi:hypothetical protein
MICDRSNPKAIPLIGQVTAFEFAYKPPQPLGTSNQRLSNTTLGLGFKRCRSRLAAEANTECCVTLCSSWDTCHQPCWFLVWLGDYDMKAAILLFNTDIGALSR